MEFPEYIEIQTFSLCNADCIICPYKQVEQELGINKMSDTVLNKILDEIEENKHHIKRVIPYLNNEPFLDKRMMSILRRLKRIGVNVEVASNFSALDMNQMKEIIDDKLIDDLRISFFAGSDETYKMMMPGLIFEKNVEKIKLFEKLAYQKGFEYCITLVLDPSLNVKEETEKIKKLFPLSKLRYFGYLDRAGNNTNYSRNTLLSSKIELNGCSLKRPFDRFCAKADGKVVICSQDWRNEEIIGNVNEELIKEIWTSSTFNELRSKVLGNQNSSDDFICKKCKLAEIKGSSYKLNFKGDKYVDPLDNKKISPL